MVNPKLADQPRVSYTYYANTSGSQKRTFMNDISHVNIVYTFLRL